MSILLKKILLSFLSFFILFFSVAPNFVIAKAQNATWYNQDFKTWFGKVSDEGNPQEIFGERYTSAQVEWVIYGIFAFFINHVTPPGTAGACIGGEVTSCISMISSYFSSISYENKTNESLAQLVFADRSLSGISYVRHTIQKFGSVPTAHAQSPGFGFSALSGPIQDMWNGFRNIAFGLFVIATVVFAFMIMFRVKISPQVVITVQSAIPKIVISLILVTFSYAIAGFLIDLMYLVIGFISLIMAPLIPTVFLLNSVNYNATDLFKLLTVGQNIGIGTGGFNGILLLLGMYLTPLFLILLVFAAIFLGIAFIPGAQVFGVVLMLLTLIIILVIVVLALWMSIKIMWALFKAFANIVLLTIFAPIQLVAGVIVPNFGFGQWARSYLSHLAVFVVTGVLWLLAYIFMLQAWAGIGDGSSLTLAGSNVSPWPPLLNVGGGTFFVFTGVSFVLFTMIPKATELVQSFLAGKPFAYGSAMGDVQQATYFLGGGAENYAALRKMKASTAAEATKWGTVQKLTEVLQSFTRPKH